MANKGSLKVKINTEKLQQAIADRGYSIRQLANEPEIARSDRTIRTALAEGEMQMELLYRICWALGLNMNQFLLKEKVDNTQKSKYEMMIVRYSSYFRMLLSMFGISMKQYYDLTENERYDLQKDLCKGISNIIYKHFRSCFKTIEDDYPIVAMDDFIDEYHGAFEPSKIDEIDAEMERGYEEYMRNNPPEEDEDPFEKKYGKPITSFED